MEYYGGSLCEVWQNVTTVGYKKNTYTLWVTHSERRAGGKEDPPIPLHYEMMGYNTLLGSHYDKYLVDYKEFSTHVDSKVFSLPEGLCSAVVAHTLKCFRNFEEEGEKLFLRKIFFDHFFPLQGWAVGDFLAQEWSTTCWPIQWKISSTRQHRATRSTSSTISKRSFSVSTAMKENTRKGSTRLFRISGERNIKIQVSCDAAAWWAWPFF